MPLTFSGSVALRFHISYDKQKVAFRVIGVSIRRMHEALMCCWVVPQSSSQCSHYAFHSLNRRWGSLFGENFYSAAQRRRVQSQPPPRCGYAAPAHIGPLRNLNPPHLSAWTCKPSLLLGREATLRCGCFFFFFFFTSSAELPTQPPKQSGPVTTAKLQKSGNFCHHERRKSQPWYLQFVAAHGQRGHPKPPFLHQLVTHTLFRHSAEPSNLNFPLIVKRTLHWETGWETLMFVFLRWLSPFTRKEIGFCVSRRDTDIASFAGPTRNVDNDTRTQVRRLAKGSCCLSSVSGVIRYARQAAAVARSAAPGWRPSAITCAACVYSSSPGAVATTRAYFHAEGFGFLISDKGRFSGRGSLIWLTCTKPAP